MGEQEETTVAVEDGPGSDPLPEAVPPEATAGEASAGTVEVAGTGEEVVVWSALGQSVAKPKNDVIGDARGQVLRPNEDRFRIATTDNRLLAAVSDGAGSSGLCCGAWAQELVDRLPKTPIGNIRTLDQWMGSFWKSFSEEAKQTVAGQPVKQTKLVREGSCATLTACWLRKDDERVRMRWLGYGDSPFFLFEWHGEEPVLTAFHPTTLAKFDLAPHLLNWKDLPQGANLRVGEVSLPGNATVVLASDGIGQFLILRFLSHLSSSSSEDPSLNEPSHSLLAEFRRMLTASDTRMTDAARRHACGSHMPFASVLNTLREGLASEEAFTALVREWNEQGLLANDDATVVLIDIRTLAAAAAERTLAAAAAERTLAAAAAERADAAAAEANDNLPAEAAVDAESEFVASGE
ncbi:MAG: hypothetical protein ABT940_05350 [Alphaproteobacteria bacterium]